MYDNIDTKEIKFILYARKSSESEERQALSIPSQVHELQPVIDRERLKVSYTKTESYSAKAPGRPVFDEVTKLIQDKKADGLLVWSPDRISRNSVDTGLIIYLLDMGLLKEVRTPTQVFRNTPADKYMLNNFCSNAKYENDNKSIAVKRGLRAKCERGLFPAPAPTGYVNDPIEPRGSKKIYPDPARFDIVERMFRMVIEQKMNPAKVYEYVRDKWRLTSKGGTIISSSTFYYMLNNPVYAGFFEYPMRSGNWYDGIHKAMITKDEYDTIQAILGNKGKPRPKSHVFDFTGLMKCGVCHGGITCEEKFKRLKSGILKRYEYYHCGKRKDPYCKQKSIEEKTLLTEIDRVLDELHIPHEFYEWAMKWIKQQNTTQVDSREKIVKQYRTHYDACLRRIDGLIDMRAGNELSEQEYKTKKAQLIKEKERLEELIDDNRYNTDMWYQKADELLYFASHAKELFRSGTRDEKRKLLSSLGSNLILQDKILCPDWKKSFKPVRELSKETTKIHLRFEPEENVDRTSQLEHLYASNPVVLPS